MTIDEAMARLEYAIKSIPGNNEAEEALRVLLAERLRLTQSLAALAHPQIDVAKAAARDHERAVKAEQRADAAEARLREVEAELALQAELAQMNAGGATRAEASEREAWAEVRKLREALDIRGRVIAMMTKRGWSLEWIHRSAYLHLEAAELAEAVRGKRGDPIEEAADVLITLLALAPAGLDVIVSVAERKIASLMDAPPYPHETRAALAAAPEPEGEEEHLKHPTGDYCVYCLSQWPCAEAEGGER